MTTTEGARDWRAEADARRRELTLALNDLDIAIKAEFVPWSESRNYKAGAKVTDKCLNWRVTVQVKGRDVLTTDYQAGIAFAPSYPSGGVMGRGLSMDLAAALDFEVENGRPALVLPGSRAASTKPKSKPIMPDRLDVLHSLLLDAEAIDYSEYEDFADNWGFDRDSRKGEAAYRQCLKIGLALRAALGDDKLAGLREAFQDY